MDVLPLEGLYVPCGQAAHADEELLPVDGLYVPAGQAVQSVWPAIILYVPALQGAQAVLSIKYIPAGQVVQAFIDVLPDDGLYIPFGHETQVHELMPPMEDFEYVPGMQLMQTGWSN